MKKLAPLLLILLILSGCKVKNYTPEIPLTIEQNVKVTSGDFSYECKICKTESDVTVTVNSTSAQGMTMIYDGENLSFSYNDFTYDINGKNFEKQNPAIVIYEVFDYINRTEQLNAKKIDNGFKYEGKISLGDFILIQNEDNSLSVLTMRNIDYKIEFLD
ncbi:MAG: hypothetical protein J1E36_01185 [Eubacterium sp.]|nr:hypothetical protein [Eubacterium sp.]